jgi:hypothetical protein
MKAQVKQGYTFHVCLNLPVQNQGNGQASTYNHARHRNAFSGVLMLKYIEYTQSQAVLSLTIGNVY